MIYPDDESVFIERRISLLETKIGQRKKSINAMKQKMAQYQDEIERKKAENRRIVAQRDALAKQLYLYRKTIQLSSKSDKTLLQYTEELFQRESDKIGEIEDQIESSEEILHKVQAYVPSIREKLADLELQIPEFRTDLLKLNFKDCLNTTYAAVNKKLLHSLKSTNFMEDQIIAKKNEKAKLMREVKALTPPKANMQLENPSKSQVRRAPKKEYQNSSSFDSIFFDKMFNQAKNVLEEYQSSLNILPNDNSQLSSLNNSPVAVSRTPTAVARRSPSSRRKMVNRKSMNNFAKTTNYDSNNMSPLTNRASARLITTPIEIEGNSKIKASASIVAARPNKRSQRRQQYKSVNLSSLSSEQLQNRSLETTNSCLQIKISTLTDSISKLNVLLGRVNKANESMSNFKAQMMKKIEDAKLKTVSFTGRSLPGVSSALNKLNETKKKIQAEKAEVAALRMDIPEQWNGSPQGLLKWQDQLLEQKEKIENTLGQQITKQENQLKDLKIFTRRRLNALRKLKDDK